MSEPTERNDQTLLVIHLYFMIRRSISLVSGSNGCTSNQPLDRVDENGDVGLQSFVLGLSEIK